MAKKIVKKKMLEELADETAESIEGAVRKKVVKKVKKVKKVTNEVIGLPSFKSCKAQLQSLEKEGFTEDTLAAGGGVLPNIGIRLPSPSLEVLFKSTVLPFGRFLLIGGPKGSFKTLFALEMASWFRDVGGKANYAENENKLEKKMVDAHLGVSTSDWFRVQYCNSLDMAQYVLTAFRRDYVNRTKRGNYTPELDVLDSVKGHGVEEQINSIANEGFAGRRHADDARSIAAYLGGYLPYFVQRPCFSTFITHGVEEKSGTSMFAKMVHRYKGANEMLFKASYVLFFKRRDKKSEETEDGTDVYGYITLDKTEGATGIKIPITVKFGYDMYMDEAGQKYYRQKSYFDWHAATVELLLSPSDCGVSPSACRALRDILPVKVERGIVICPSVGLKAEDNANAAQFVEALRNSGVTYRSFCEIMGISSDIVYDGTQSFTELRDQAVQAVLSKTDQPVDYDKLTIVQRFGGQSAQTS